MGNNLPDRRLIKKIHFMGIKGVGMAPLAIIAKEAGIDVTGSDIDEEFITDNELISSGITLSVGFSKENVKGVDLVIYTSAHGGLQNPEVQFAEDSNIETLNQGRALAQFQSGDMFGKKFFGISVAGSHGKTTTTAMIATLFANNGLDPSYVIGTSSIPSLGFSGHFGQGKYFITEADEYFADPVNDKTPKFLLQNPKIAIVTNVDFDHPDIFPSINEVRDAFLKLAGKLPAEGILIACGDGEENRKFLSQFHGKKITYGFSIDCDFVLERVSSSPDKTFFWVRSAGTILGQFSLQVFGEQNALNAVSAIIAGLEVGLSIEQIKKGLSKFSGTKRRSEFVGNLQGGGLIYDDYAHHPEEIKKTLGAFRKSFPKHKIIVMFQPHMYSRTKKLFGDFSTSFSDADEILVIEIFPSFREQVDPNFSSRLLVEEIKKYSKSAFYFEDLRDVVKYLSSRNFDRNTLLITMGAGNVYKIGKELLRDG